MPCLSNTKWRRCINVTKERDVNVIKRRRYAHFTKWRNANLDVRPCQRLNKTLMNFFLLKDSQNMVPHCSFKEGSEMTDRVSDRKNPFPQPTTHGKCGKCFRLSSVVKLKGNLLGSLLSEENSCKVNAVETLITLINGTFQSRKSWLKMLLQIITDASCH